MGCSTSLAKLFLFVFNIAFFIFGIASLGLGIWVVVNRNDLFRFINLLDAKITDGASSGDISSVANQSGTVTAAGYILIGLGLFTLLVGFCGCCGAMKESKCLLTIYAALVGLVLVIEIAAAIMAAVFQNHVRSTTVEGMQRLQDKFFVSIPHYLRLDKSGGQALVTFLINYVQLMFECCGAHSVGDIANSSSWRASNRTYGGQELLVPLTCCRLRRERKNAVMDPRYSWMNFTTELEDSNCPYKPVASNGGLNNMTCYNSLLEYVSHYSRPLIGICVGIGLFELLGILLACCLIRAVENDVSYAKQ